jgi:hypothetical protein
VVLDEYYEQYSEQIFGGGPQPPQTRGTGETGFGVAACFIGLPEEPGSAQLTTAAGRVFQISVDAYEASFPVNLLPGGTLVLYEGSRRVEGAVGSPAHGLYRLTVKKGGATATASWDFVPASHQGVFPLTATDGGSLVRGQNAVFGIVGSAPNSRVALGLYRQQDTYETSDFVSLLWATSDRYGEALIDVPISSEMLRGSYELVLDPARSTSNGHLAAGSPLYSYFTVP